MPHPSTTISGYLCEIEPNADRPGVNCYVSKGAYSASLACLEDTAQVTNMDTGDERPVPSNVIDKIRAWADANGYDD